MSLITSKNGPVYDPGTCRCCGASKKCRLLNIEYNHLDKKEIYFEMFVECFGLVLSHLDGEPTDRLICAMCVSRLREASLFRLQVLQCEEKMLQSRICVYGDDMSFGPAPIEIKTEVTIKVENDESEAMYCDDNFANDGMVNNITENLEATVSTKEANVISSKISKDYLRGKKQLLQRMQKLKDRLKRMQQTKKPKADTYPQPVTDKFIDEDSLSYQNSLTYVETSYICPFQTSYSSYYCLYCKATFSNPIKLREHNLKHNPKDFKKAFNRKKATYLDIERIDCRLCDEGIDDFKSFKNHISLKHGKYLHNVKDDLLKFRLQNGATSCVECGKAFVFFHALKRHMAEHFGTFVCDICGAHYFDKRTLELHSKNTHANDDRYSCHECGRLFKSKHTMLFHVSSIHKKEAAFQCSKCDDSLFSLKERYKHMLEVHGEARALPCDSCGKVFNTRKNLREHNRTVHLRIFKHKCGICERGFAQHTRLNEHLMSMHRNERSFQCDLCGNSYPRLHYLKLHIQSHSQH